jgi:hypothetical protein
VTCRRTACWATPRTRASSPRCWTARKRCVDALPLHVSARVHVDACVYACVCTCVSALRLRTFAALARERVCVCVRACVVALCGS